MEIIIFAIIAFIINAISKRKKPVDEPSMSKPLDQRYETRDEDYQKETYENKEEQIPDRHSRTHSVPGAREQQSRTQSVPGARESRSRTQTAPDAREPMSQAPTLKEQLDKIQKTRKSGRLSTHNPVVETVVKKSNPSFLVPTTEKNLIQAIIFSEIISSPKSKR